MVLECMYVYIVKDFSVAYQHPAGSRDVTEGGHCRLRRETESVE